MPIGGYYFDTITRSFQPFSEESSNAREDFAKDFKVYTDDDLMVEVMFDICCQNALHPNSFAEQPVSDRTLSRFRERLYTEALAGGMVSGGMFGVYPQLAGLSRQHS